MTSGEPGSGAVGPACSAEAFSDGLAVAGPGRPNAPTSEGAAETAIAARRSPGFGEHGDQDRDPEHPAGLAQHAVGAGGLADLRLRRCAHDRAHRLVWPGPVSLRGAVLERRKRSRQSLSGTSHSNADTAPAVMGRIRVF
jgi:hypothetical protein